VTLFLETAGRRVTAVRRPLPAIATPLAVFGLLTIWSAALQLPFIGERGADDPFFLEVAHLWLSGAPPYLHAFDIKPPGFFALVAMAETLFGPNLSAVNALTVLCETATAFCLWRIGRQLCLPAVGVFAAVAYPLLSQMLSNNLGYPTLAMATTAAFALATAPFGWRARVGWSGLALGVALTMKQTACLEGLALLWLLMREPEARGNRLRTLLGFTAAAAAPWLVFVLILAAQGALAPLIHDTVVVALHRPGLENESLARIYVHFDSVQHKIWPIVIAAAIGLALYRRLLPGAPAGRKEALVLWLAISYVELLLQHARWVIYLGPTFAPLLLVSGAAVSVLLPSETLKRAALAVLLLATFFSAYPFRIWSFLEASDEPAIAIAAPEILARDPKPNDRLLTLLQGDRLNVVLGLRPPTPFFHWMHLVCDFPGAGPPQLREALDAAPRFIVAPAHPFRPFCQDPGAWPMIRAALAQHYRHIGEASAQGVQLEVYERLAAP
jgi:hypothetical protein